METPASQSRLTITKRKRVFMGVLAAFMVPHPPLIIPAVGRGKEKEIQSTIDAYEDVARRIADLKPDTIVIASPHAPGYRNGFYVSGATRANGTLQQFGVWDVAVGAPCDKAFEDRLVLNAQQAGVPTQEGNQAVEDLDHATVVPLWFLTQQQESFELVSLGLSGLDGAIHKHMGEIIAQTADDLNRRMVFIASGDLSHCLLPDGPYGFKPQGPVFDHTIMDLVNNGNLEGFFDFDPEFIRQCDQCGLGSFQIMAGVLDGKAYTHEVLSYEGPFGVGYGVACFHVLNKTSAEETTPESPLAHPDDRYLADDQHSNTIANEEAVDPYVALARRSVESYVRDKTVLEMPTALPPELSQARAGVFVSLHEKGALRGCIGTIEPAYGNVAEEIIANGIAAATRDPRFSPVTVNELDYLDYSVDVLYPPRPVTSLDELDPKRFGVIVTQGSRRGLLLPNLEGVDTVAAQIAIAKQKAGIDPADADVDLACFEVVRHTKGGEPKIC